MASELSAGTPLPLGTRLWFAWVCLFRVLFDGAFARRAFDVRGAAPEPVRLPAAAAEGQGAGGEEEPPPVTPEAPRPSLEAPRPDTEQRRRLAHTVREPRPDPAAVAAAREAGALALLALLQREGRLVDFLQQDVASFADDEIGAAARVVHAGCRKALAEHATIAEVLSDEEGATVEVPEGYEPATVKLVGDVKGAPPFSGKLRHRGWRASTLKLPEPVAGHDPRVLAPAEVEL
jgi:hypothetical protein